MRQRIDASLEEISERTGRTCTERYRQVGRLEAQLVHSSNVFTNEVNSVAAANRRRMTPEQVIGKSDARGEAFRVVVLQRGVIAGARESRQIQLVRAASVDERIL